MHINIQYILHLSFGNRCFKPFFPQDIEEYETVKVAVRAFSCAHEEYIVRVLARRRNKFEHYFSTTITPTYKRYNICFSVSIRSKIFFTYETKEKWLINWKNSIRYITLIILLYTNTIARYKNCFFFYFHYESNQYFWR